MASKVLDDRAPVCPNGCGLLSPLDETSIECDTCGYERQVIADGD